MAYILTAADKVIIHRELAALANAAPEHPLNERTAKQLARVSVASGYTASKAAFIEAIGDRPLHTLISFARFLGA